MEAHASHLLEKVIKHSENMALLNQAPQLVAWGIKQGLLRYPATITPIKQTYEEWRKQQTFIPSPPRFNITTLL